MDTTPTQVKVIFSTNEEDLQLPESKQQLLVPGGKNPNYVIGIGEAVVTD